MSDWVTTVGIFFLALAITLLDASGDVARSSSTKREVKIRNKREGSWSGWSSWSPCSRTCGGGIRTQTRQCQIRRGRGGGGKLKDILEDSKSWKNVSSRHCEGHATRHHLCNTHECPKGSIDFRESQCKAFDNRPFMGKVYQWEAFTDERSPCSLTCRAKGFRFFATLSKSVIDGTPCKNTPLELNVCISGTCMPIGCDGIAGSQRRMDRCGVCGGDNSTCRVISGIFTRPQLPVGYNMVAHIPKGACNLNITQIRRSPNYLALRTNDGAYVLNGNWAINWPGEYEGAGAKFVYQRQDLKSFESIASPGPLREPIDLLVLYQQPNPGIKYEYMLPMNDAPIPAIPADGVVSVAPHHRQASSGGRVVPYVTPGNGAIRNGNTIQSSSSTHQLKPSALSSAGTSVYVATGEASPAYSISGSGTPSKVNSPVIVQQAQPIQQQQPAQPQQQHHPHLHNHHGRRNRNHPHQQHHRAGGGGNGKDDKKFYWKITGYSNCSEACGGGTQKSIVRCVRGVNGVPVSDRRCPVEEKPLGQTIRCNLKPCPAEWIAGVWSACSEVCGPDGYQTRAVHCQQRISPTLTMRVAEGACLDKQPETKRPCFTKPCHRWETTSWSECSATCGNGIRSRKVTCVISSGEKIENSNCEAGDKPLEISPCNMGPCEGVDWFTSDWSSECSQTCGSGYQSRHVVCGVLGRRNGRGSEETNLVEDDGGDDDDGNNLASDDSSCDAGKRPAGERDCFTEKNCGEPAWFAGPWGQCSSSCGEGLKSRQILCVLFNRGKFKVVEDSQCSSEDKPEERMPCEKTTSCPPRWFTTEWSECSVPCGGGTQRRSVSCRASNWTLSFSSCLDGERPLDRRSCNEHKCSASTRGTSTDRVVKETGDGTAVVVANIQAEPTARSIHSSSSNSNSNNNNNRLSHEDSSSTRPIAAPLIQNPQQRHHQHHHSSSSSSSSTDHHNENEPNEEPDDTECTDQYRNCPLVVQARLCRYKYYRSVCCSACTDSSWQNL